MTPNEYYESFVQVLDGLLPQNLIFAEIGTATGTTAIWAIKALAKNNSRRWLFTIDPYGDKPYVIGDTTNLQTYGYDDKTYRKAMRDIKHEAYEREVNHTHWHMRSQDYIKFFEQIEFWTEGGKLKPKYGMAYLDGEHAFDPVLDEFRFFYHRMPVLGTIIIDDWNLLGDEAVIREHLIGLPGVWDFRTDDNHYRAYFTKI